MISVACHICGTPFSVKPYKIAEGTGKYCSRHCAHIALSTRATVLCHVCAMPFSVKTSAIARGGGKYCSQRCHWQGITIPIADRFWKYVEKCTHGETCCFCCWKWLGAHYKNGYGVAVPGNGVGAKHVTAHRVAWELWHTATMPKHLEAAHYAPYCANPGCVNPQHVYAATHQENVDDIERAGHRLHGSKHPKAKFDTATIEDLWRLHKQGWTGKDLALFFNVSRTTISRVLNGKRYRIIHNA